MPRAAPASLARGTSSRWTAWQRLSPGDRRATLAAAALLPILGASLRVLGLRATVTWVARATRQRQLAPAEQAAIVTRALDAIQRVERHGIYRGTCLSRSLALAYLLGRAGLTTDLRFGGRKIDGRFAAHAWLEHDGVPINETADVARRLTPFEVPRERPPRERATREHGTPGLPPR